MNFVPFLRNSLAYMFVPANALEANHPIVPGMSSTEVWKQWQAALTVFSNLAGNPSSSKEWMKDMKLSLLLFLEHRIQPALFASTSGAGAVASATGVAGVFVAEAGLSGAASAVDSGGAPAAAGESASPAQQGSGGASRAGGARSAIAQVVDAVVHLYLCYLVASLDPHDSAVSDRGDTLLKRLDGRMEGLFADLSMASVSEVAATSAEGLSADNDGQPMVAYYNYLLWHMVRLSTCGDTPAPVKFRVKVLQFIQQRVLAY